jgi:hypothetical protein
VEEKGCRASATGVKTRVSFFSYRFFAIPGSMEFIAGIRGGTYSRRGEGRRRATLSRAGELRKARSLCHSRKMARFRSRSRETARVVVGSSHANGNRTPPRLVWTDRSISSSRPRIRARADSAPRIRDDRVLGDCLKEELPTGMSSGARRGPGRLPMCVRGIEQTSRRNKTSGGEEGRRRRQRRPARWFALIFDGRPMVANRSPTNLGTSAAPTPNRALSSAEFPPVAVDD